MLPDLFFAVALFLNPAFLQPGGPAQPPAHTVPSQRAEQPAPGAGVIVSLPKQLSGNPGELISIQAESGAPLVSWNSSPGIRIVNDDPPDPIGKLKLLHAKTAGVYFVVAMIPSDAGGVRSSVCVVTIGDAPKPDPPGPKPPPGPVPTSSFRVLFVYESSNTLTKSQNGVLNSTAIRDYLNKHCVTGDDGKTPDYRFFDKDVDVSSAGPTIKAMWESAKSMFKDLPIIVIFDGLKGTAYPLPANEKEALELLKKFGGP